MADKEQLSNTFVMAYANNEDLKASKEAHNKAVRKVISTYQHYFRENVEPTWNLLGRKGVSLNIGGKQYLVKLLPLRFGAADIQFWHQNSSSPDLQIKFDHSVQHDGYHLNATLYIDKHLSARTPRTISGVPVTGSQVKLPLLPDHSIDETAKQMEEWFWAAVIPCMHGFKMEDFQDE